jgi:hypothetical protein
MGFDLYALDDEGPSGYFRATLTGMSELRHALLDAGVFDDHAVMPAVEWPTPPSGYDERVEREEPLTESDREYEAECRRVATQASPTPGQVAGWKLVFNDGWVVTPEECVWMADGLDRYCSQNAADDRDHLAWVASFAEFCRHCATSGGFEVR